MAKTKTKGSAREYKISDEQIVSSYYREVDMMLLRDLPEGVEPPIQLRYLNDVMGMFLRLLVKVYEEDRPLVDSDKEKLKKYLDRIFEAKEAYTPVEPKGGMYLRKP